VADDLGSNVDIYCYYGNSVASNVSNGDNVFDLFDDFDGSLDTNKWTTTGSDYLISNSNIKLNTDLVNPGPELKSVKTYTSGNYLLNAKVVSHTDFVRFIIGWSNNYYNYDDGGSTWWGLVVNSSRVDTWGYDIPNNGLVGNVSLAIAGKQF